jgi:hypothetical protein
VISFKAQLLSAGEIALDAHSGREGPDPRASLGNVRNRKTSCLYRESLLCYINRVIPILKGSTDFNKNVVNEKKYNKYLNTKDLVNRYLVADI